MPGATCPSSSTRAEGVSGAVEARGWDVRAGPPVRPGDSQPTATFASREEFIRWLAQRSDEVFAKEEHPDDPRMWGHGTFNRAFFARKTGRRS